MGKHPRTFSPYDEAYWASIAAGEMRLQKCKDCATLRYLPSACCPKCLSVEADWVPVSGRATLLSWTTFHRQYLPAYPVPFTVIAVQLEEGPMMISNIDEAERPSLAVGAALSMTYADHPDGYRIPRFTTKTRDPR